MNIGISVNCEGFAPMNTIYIVSAVLPLVDGTFTLTFDGMTTAPLDHGLFTNFDAIVTANAILDALENLSTIGPGNVIVTAVSDNEPDVLIEFVGDLAQSGQMLSLTDQSESASAGVYCNIAQMGTSYGEDTVLSLVFAETPTWGHWYLSFNSARTAPIPATASDAEIEAALWALPALGPHSVGVSGAGTLEDPMLFSFGGAMAEMPLDGTLAADGSELYSGSVPSGGIFGPGGSIFGPSIIARKSWSKH